MEERKQAWTTEYEMYTIGGIITTDGAGDPTLSDSVGIASVSRTGVGTYKVVLKDRWKRLIGAVPTIKLAASNLQTRVSAHSVAAASPYITILTHESTGGGSATATNQTASTGLTVNTSAVNVQESYAASLPAAGVAMHAQDAGGAPLALVAGFTNPLPRRNITITRSAAGPATVDYTVRIYAPDGGYIDEVVTVGSGAAASSLNAGEVTAVSTTVDPVSTTDFDTGPLFAVGAIFSAGTLTLACDGVVEATTSEVGAMATVGATTAPNGVHEFTVQYSTPNSHSTTEVAHTHTQNAHTHTSAGAAANLVSGELHFVAVLQRR